MSDAQTLSAGDHLKNVGNAARDFGSRGYNHVRDHAHRASTAIQKDGFGAIKGFAGRHPLLMGAAAVTTAFVATTAVMGHHRRKELERRQSQEIQR